MEQHSNNDGKEAEAFRVTVAGPRSLIVDVPYRKQGEPVSVLLMSDIHIDSVHCRHVLVRKHLDEARKRGAIILITGDLIDAMNGRADPRGEMGQIIPELRCSDYFDAVVDYAADFLGPYAGQLAVIGEGNHETAVLRHRNTNLTQRIVGNLRTLHKSPVEAMGYSGWVLFRLRGSDKKVLDTATFYFHHGAAKSGSGIGEMERVLSFTNADVIHLGHNHRHVTSYHVREEVTQNGVVTPKTVVCVRTPGYKDEWTDEKRGFAQERNHGPRPLGSVFVFLSIEGGGSRSSRLRITTQEMVGVV